MQEIIGSSNKVLEVDISAGTYFVQKVSAEDRKQYLGAKGLGLKLIYDRIQPGVDPLGPKNILAVMPGVLMATGAPCSGRFHALAKSPLTGIFTSSSCGGRFGRELKTAGWDGLIIYGQAEEPIWLEIDSSGVCFHSASELWGLEISKAEERLRPFSGASLVIGPGGENLVRFANIASNGRFLGRGGMGAVLGAKKVKAVVARGSEYKILPAWPETFKKTKQKAGKYIKRNRMTGYLYRNFGTNANVNFNNAAGILPVNNFSTGRHDQAWLVSGEAIKDLHQTSHHTCKPCSILCGYKGIFNGKNTSVPEYETNFLLGTNLGIFDPDKIAKWNDLCSELGLDTISTGSVLAWCMEAAEKGIRSSNLKFSSSEGIAKTIENIGYAREEGVELGLGTRYLGDKYGGKGFAIQIKGLEMAGYDPRGSFGHGLAYAVANRGACHLSAFLVALEVYFGLLNPFSPRAKPRFVKFFEGLTNCVNSLQTCQFTMFAYTLEPAMSKYTPNLFLKLLMQNLPSLAIALIDFSVYRDLWSSVTGIKISNQQFLKAGQRIHLLERYMNTREGVDSSQDVLPERLSKFCLDSVAEQKSIPLKKMLKEYYRLRGYSKQGIPKQRVLKRHKISVKV